MYHVMYRYGLYLGGICLSDFFGWMFSVFQPGFVAFVASVAFVGWALWLYHSLLVYLSIYLI